jgi:hypothetical protein
VVLSFYIVHPIFSFISEIILYHLEDNEIPLKNAQWIINLIHVIFIVFYVFWFIVGNVIYFVANGCSDFEEGYRLTLAMISIHYIACGIVYVAFCGNFFTFLARLK